MSNIEAAKFMADHYGFSRDNWDLMILFLCILFTAPIFWWLVDFWFFYTSSPEMKERHLRELEQNRRRSWFGPPSNKRWTDSETFDVMLYQLVKRKSEKKDK